MRNIFDKRTHSYAILPVDRLQISGNFRQVRQALEDREESTAAGGDNERGLAPHEFPQGFARRIPKPTKEQFDQWRFEEPDLLRKLQGGDYGAAALLAERYRWWIQYKASRAVRKVSGGLYFGDVFGCALVRFCQCLKQFKPGSNNGLMAYLTKAVDGAISDAQHDWQRKGFAGLDTRLRRFLRNEDNREMPLEEIQKLFPKYTLEQIALAQEPIVMQSYGEGAVDDGNGHQDADDHNAPSGYAIAAASADPINAQRSTSSQWSKRAGLGPVKWLRDGPVSEISMPMRRSIVPDAASPAATARGLAPHQGAFKTGAIAASGSMARHGLIPSNVRLPLATPTFSGAWGYRASSNGIWITAPPPILAIGRTENGAVVNVKRGCFQPRLRFNARALVAARKKSRREKPNGGRSKTSVRSGTTAIEALSRSKREA